MMIALHTSRKRHLFGSVSFGVTALLWIGGCAPNKAALMQEIEVLLQQTREEVRQEAHRMDTEIARLRSEVGQVDAKVGRLGSAVGQLGSEVALMQLDMRKNDTSIVDLVKRVNQLDQRVGQMDTASSSNSEGDADLGDVSGSPMRPQRAADAVASPSVKPGITLKLGMSQREILRLFGNPHSMERILDAVYWYYADGELKGQYVRFDATTGQVNGWSTSSTQRFQIDLRTTQERPVP
jgi:hypothetical protein